MSDELAYLKRVVSEKTAGPCVFRDGYYYQEGDEFDYALWRANPLENDARFFEIVGTIAEELLAVVEAAARFDDEDVLGDTFMEAQCLLSKSVAALKAKIKESM